MCDICLSRSIDKPAIAWEETDKRLKLIEQKLERLVQVVDKPAPLPPPPPPPSVLSGSDTRPQKPQPPDPSCFNGIRIQNLKEPDHELSSDNMESDMAKVCDIRPEWPKCNLCRIRILSSKPSELMISKD